MRLKRLERLLSLNLGIWLDFVIGFHFAVGLALFVYSVEGKVCLS